MATKKAVPVTEEEAGLVPLDAGLLKVDEVATLEPEDEPVVLTAEEARDSLASMVPMRVVREYRLELFEEGDNRAYGRQRGLAREGWEFPAVHGFQRNLMMNRGTDRFFIVVASRDTEVPA